MLTRRELLAPATTADYGGRLVAAWLDR